MSSPAPDTPLVPSPVELPSFGGYSAEPDGLIGVEFWPRVGARVIDLIAHYVVVVIASFMFGILLVIAAGGHPSPEVLAKLQQTGFQAYVFALLGSIAFQTICEGVHGSSPGKLALSMVVVQEDGSPCRMGSALIRSFAYLIDALFFGVIGYLAMQKSNKMQRHGDEWAHTVVCKRSQVRPENLRGGGRFVMALMLAAMADAALIILSLLLKLTTGG